MKEILSAAKAAKVIGCSEQMVRERIKKRIWKFGKVVNKKESGMSNNSYEISKRALAEWLGMSVEEIDKKLKEDAA